MSKPDLEQVATDVQEFFKLVNAVLVEEDGGIEPCRSCGARDSDCVKEEPDMDCLHGVDPAILLNELLRVREQCRTLRFCLRGTFQLLG